MEDRVEAEVVERLDAYIVERLGHGGPPGVAVAITDRDRTMHVGTHGLANVDAALTLTPDHLFEIGSVGKGFTAVLVLQLAAEGLIDLHAPVTDYVPWFEVDSAFGPITTHHLLSHSAGLITGSLAFIDARSEVWALRRTRTGAAPGEFFHYSDVGYETIGLIVGAVMSRPFREVLAERVLTPLGMHDSLPHFLNDARARLALGYTPAFDDVPFVPGRSQLSPAPWFVGDSADGSISSTPQDMTAYLRLLLNRGAVPGGRLISPEAFTAMTTPWIRREDEDDESYGYGIGIHETAGHTVLRHSGGTIGYITQLLVDLDAGVGVIVLTNGPFEIYSIVRSFAQFALDLAVAAHAGERLPEAPQMEDPTHVADAGVFAGSYRGDAGTISIDTDGTSMSLTDDSRTRTLVRIERDASTFAIDGDEDAWLEFIRDDQGDVTEVFLGRHRFASDHDEGPDDVPYPPAWDTFAGLYRAHDPWRPAIRFVMRMGVLWMILPTSATAEPLTPDGEATFRFARDDRLPERIRFHAFADGRPLRVEIEGFDHYRAPDRHSAWNDRSE